MGKNSEVGGVEFAPTGLFFSRFIVFFETAVLVKVNAKVSEVGQGVNVKLGGVFHIPER